MSRQVSVEKESSIARKISVVISKDEIIEKQQAKVRQFMNAKVKGFRKGKAPKARIEKSFGGDIRAEVISQLIDNTTKEIVKEHGLKLASSPKISNVVNEADKDLEYVIKVDVFPELELADFNTLVIDKPIVTVTDEDIEIAIKELQRRFASINEIKDRPIQMTDLVRLQVLRRIDDGVDVDLSGQNNNLNIDMTASGEVIYLKKIINALLGKSINDVIFVEDNVYPEDYSDSALRGKNFAIELKILAISEVVLHERNEKLAEMIGVEDKDANKIAEKVRSNLEKTKTELVDAKMRKEAINALLKITEIDVPEELVLHEAQHVLKNIMQQGGNMDSLGLKSPSDFWGSIRQRVKEYLLLDAIITKITNSNGVSTTKEINNPEDADDASNYQSATEAILGQAQLVEKNYTFRELVNSMVEG